MIRQLGDTFVLDTDHTTYCFRRLATGQLEHLYYGKKIYITCGQDAEALAEQMHLAIRIQREEIFDAMHRI